MDKKFDGARLRFARLFRGKTLTELANDTEISKQLISQYENDESKPSYDKLSIIAEKLKFPNDYFMQADRYQPKAEVTYFRSLMSAGKMDRASQSYKLMVIGELYMALHEYIDFPDLNKPDVFFSGVDSDTVDEIHAKANEEIEEIAAKTREYWGLDDGPIDDMQFLLEQNGIIVTGYDTNTDDIDAFTQRTLVGGENLFIIAVDQGRKPEGRIRFDLAHELGHILIHPWSESVDELSREEFRMREDQANRFASAFLLPRKSFSQDVRPYVTDLQYYVHLKEKWNVSIAAMLYRAHTLGLLTTNQFQYLMRQYSKKGWRKHEPGDEPYLLNENVFQGAIDVLYEAKIFNPVSMWRFFASRGITLHPHEIETLLNLRPGTLQAKEERPRHMFQVLKGSEDPDGTSPNTEPTKREEG